MQSGFTGHVTPVEWRWVLVVSIMLVGLAFVPFLWVVISSDADSGWQFMGALHGHVEASAYLSRIRQGMEGETLIQFLHTPETHPRFILQPIYPFLGQISRLASDSLSPILVFHVARVSVTVFMYLALYQLASTIWLRVRTRRIFFLLVSVSSGFGWLVVLFTGGKITSNPPIDLTHSQISPFFSGLVSIHIPLAIACLALLSAIIVAALRPGIESVPSVRNSGIIAFVLGIMLILLYPEAYALYSVSLGITIGVQWYFAKKITQREILWMMWILVPALPILIYYILIIRSNPFVMEWIQQQASYPIDAMQLLIGLGGLLFVGLPSIVRAIRRFESDGDRFMIIWLMVAGIGSLMPINIRAHFLIGVMIPIAYFATRSIEDVWLKYFPRRYRSMVFAVSVASFMISNLFVLLIPLLPLSSDIPTESAGLVMSTEYRATLEWLDKRVSDTDVVLSAPEVGTWIPLWLGVHSIAGHPYETMDAPDKIKAISEWYQLETPEECENSTLQIDGFQQTYTVKYVIYGDLERRLGDGVCLQLLNFAASFGDVEIYRVPMNFPG
jgi:hypothetical protein